MSPGSCEVRACGALTSRRSLCSQTKTVRLANVSSLLSASRAEPIIFWDVVEGRLETVDVEAPLAVTSDASDTAMGAVLEQFNNGSWEPLAFFVF